MTPGLCRYCACSETNPCIYGCAWTDDTRTLCSVCADAVGTARALVDAAGVAIATEGIRLVTSSFDRLPLERQAILVKTCRELVDSVREGIALALNDEAIEAVRQVDTISGFLLEHFPQEVGDDDTAADVIARVLTPHIGSRIIVPGGGR